MKDMRELLDTFTEEEWKKAKKEMTKRIPSMEINKMSMDEFQTLARFLASPDFSDIDEYIVDIASKEGLSAGLQEIDGGVTVHNACHARAQNMGIKARDMLKNIPNIKLDIVERCAGHGGTFGVMKDTHDLANKVGRPTARQIDNKKNKYMASDCPLAGKHLNQLTKDTDIKNDEALHPIEIMAKAYKL